MPKLTLEQEEKICQEYLNTNITHKELAIKYNCSRPLITILLQKKNIKRTYVLSNTKLSKLIKCNENYFEVIDTPAKSYYLGFIAADGNLNPQSNSLNIKLNIKDKEFLQTFLNALESDHSVYEIKSFDYKRNKIYYSAEIRICRPKLFDDLTFHGIGQNKSKELSIPKTIPQNLIKHFIRGVHCGDGTWVIDKKNDIHFGIVSSVYSFAEELKSVLIKQCDAFNVKIIPKPGCYSILWGGNIQCKRIYDYLYSDGGPWLERKYELSTKHFENLKNGIKTREIDNRRKIENPKILSDLDRILGFGKTN